MPSAQQPAFRVNSHSKLGEPTVLWDELPSQTGRPNLNESIATALRAKRIALALEHRDLDSTISVLTEAATCDELLISRLKKRRLHLRDEIARIEGYLPT